MYIKLYIFRQKKIILSYIIVFFYNKIMKNSKSIKKNFNFLVFIYSFS